MRITDNMLRVISHAYLNNTPGIFLVKAGLYDITDDFTFLKKSYLVVGLLTNLINKATTDSEKAFFSYNTTSTQYVNKIAKEKVVVLDAVTIKEFIIGNGLVYSEFLDYIYIALTKYNPKVPSIDILEKSIDKTLNKLKRVSGIKEEEIKGFSIFNAISEIESLSIKAKELTKDIEEKTSHIDKLNKAISTAKETLETSIDTIRLTDTTTEDTNDIKLLQDSLDKEIINLKTSVIKKQVISLTNSLKTRIELLDTKSIETKAVNDILSIVDIIVDRVENTSDDLGYLKITSSLNRLDDLLRTVVSNNKDKANATNNLIESLNSSVNDLDSYFN